MNIGELIQQLQNYDPESSAIIIVDQPKSVCTIDEVRPLKINVVHEQDARPDAALIMVHAEQPVKLTDKRLKSGKIVSMAMLRRL